MGLVVIGEDDPELCSAMRLMFSRAGHRVLTAVDGASTLDLVQRWRPDLVLLDVSMPVMSGLEVCRAVRADPTVAALPVVIVSAWGFDSDIAAGHAAEADAYVTKPFETAALLARAEALMGSRRRNPATD